jgi:hypothetical protein
MGARVQFHGGTVMSPVRRQTRGMSRIREPAMTRQIGLFATSSKRLDHLIRPVYPLEHKFTDAFFR